MHQIDRHLLDLAAENLLEVATTQAMETEAQSSLVKECLVVIHKEGDWLLHRQLIATQINQSKIQGLLVLTTTDSNKLRKILLNNIAISNNFTLSKALFLFRVWEYHNITINFRVLLCIEISTSTFQTTG